MPHPTNVPLTHDVIDYIFAYHAPVQPQVDSYAAIRYAAKNLATVILENCPDCADRSAAIRKVREAVMTANASIALS